MGETAGGASGRNPDPSTGAFGAGRQTRDAPAWATKVEVATIISGHGWGRDMENCAEFCNHTHHFTVNGTENQIRHDNADEALPGTILNYGCANLVSVGVVPNQFGTWPYARAGWCPGLDVPPKRIDITAQVLGADPDVREFYLGMGSEGVRKSFREVKHYKRRKRWLS